MGLQGGPGSSRSSQNPGKRSELIATCAFREPAQSRSRLLGRTQKKEKGMRTLPAAATQSYPLDPRPRLHSQKHTYTIGILMRALRWSSEAESKAPIKSAPNRCQLFLGSALLRLSACRRSMLCKLREMNHATEKSITEIRIVVRASSKTKSIRQKPKGVQHSLLPLKRASSTARSGRERRVSAIRKTSQGGLQSLRTCRISICPRGSVGANKDRLPTLLKNL